MNTKGSTLPFLLTKILENKKRGVKMNTEILLFVIIGFQIATLFVLVRGAQNGN